MFTKVCSCGQTELSLLKPYPIPGRITSILSSLTFPFIPLPSATKTGLNLAPFPSCSLQVETDLAFTPRPKLGIPPPNFLTITPTVDPISSMIGSALIGVVLCRASKIISGKHGFLLNRLLLQSTGTCG